MCTSTSLPFWQGNSRGKETKIFLGFSSLVDIEKHANNHSFWAQLKVIVFNKIKFPYCYQFQGCTKAFSCMENLPLHWRVSTLNVFCAVRNAAGSSRWLLWQVRVGWRDWWTEWSPSERTQRETFAWNLGCFSNWAGLVTKMHHKCSWSHEIVRFHT